MFIFESMKSLAEMSIGSGVLFPVGDGEHRCVLKTEHSDNNSSVILTANVRKKENVAQSIVHRAVNEETMREYLRSEANACLVRFAIMACGIGCNE